MRCEQNPMSQLVLDVTMAFKRRRFALVYMCVCLCSFAQDCLTDRLVYLGVQATCDQSEAVQCERIPHLSHTC